LTSNNDRDIKHSTYKWSLIRGNFTYIALFGRPADPLGLEFFNEATGNGADLTAIGDLSSTDEYQSRFEGKDNASIVTDIYQSLFGRNPEQAGLAFFVNALNSGTLNINNVAIAILDGAKGDDLATVNNKITAADAFTAAIDTPDELAAYRGDSAAGLGRDFLTGITADEASIPTAAQVDAAVANVVTNGNPGDAFALTVGPDTLVGTNLADVFTAAAVSSTGAAVTTLNAGDSVDGGAGVDTLKLTATAANNKSLVGSVKNVEIIEIKGSDFIDRAAAAPAAVTAAQTALVTAQTALDLAKSNLTAAINDATVVKGAITGAVFVSDNATTTTALNDAIDGSGASNAAKAEAKALVNAATFTDNASVTTVVTAINTALNNHVTTDSNAVVTATNDVATKQAAYDAVVAGGRGTIDASFFVGSTDISVDGTKTDVTDATSQTIHFTAGGNTAIANSVAYDEDVTSAKIDFVNTHGAVAVGGDDLKSLTITGSIHTEATNDPGALTITQTGTTELTSLTLNLSVGGDLNVAGLTDLTSIDASASTGALGKASGTGAYSVDLTNLVELTSYKGSQGADVIIVAQDATVNRVIETGTGNDRVHLEGDGLAAGEKGTLSINLGTGVDRVDIANGLTNITTATESKFLDGAIKIAGFGADDVFNAGDLGNRDVLTADVQSDISASETLWDAVKIAFDNTAEGNYSTFVYGGNTYVFANNDADGNGATNLLEAGDGLVEITGFTGALTDTNFIA